MSDPPTNVSEPRNIAGSGQLTEFAPLTPDDKQESSGFSFSRLFKRRSQSREPSPSQRSAPNPKHEDVVAELPSNVTGSTFYRELPNRDGMTGQIGARTLPAILQRVSSMLASKSETRTYSESELREYWMPDHVSKECYDCGVKFTTLRRRHHCRVCGQIFCSRCCSDEVPGKVLGQSAPLRVCAYCCKVVTTYLETLQSGGIKGDQSAVYEKMKNTFIPSENLSPDRSPFKAERPSLRRKTSSVVGYQEENFTKGNKCDMSPSDYGEEPWVLGLGSYSAAITQQIAEVWNKMRNPYIGLSLGTHRYLLQHYPECLVGSQLVDWLVIQGYANDRLQAQSLGQSLMDRGLMIAVSHADAIFRDEYALYRPSEFWPEKNRGSTDNHDRHEPLWLSQIDRQNSNSDETDGAFESGTPNSNASYMSTLNNDIDPKDTFQVPRSKTQPEEICRSDPLTQHRGSIESTSSLLIRDGIYNSTLFSQEENEESMPTFTDSSDVEVDKVAKLATEALQKAYKEHELLFLNQLLVQEGLSSSWSSIILPLVHKVTSVIKPDVKHDNDEMDIRQYIHVKKIPSGSQSECEIINGIVCTKNLVHKAMSRKLVDPLILLLSMSIVYHRDENKLVSLEPLFMQQQEYLKNTVAKIVSLNPDIVLVENTVSSIAKDMLLGHGISLAVNVKPSVMERVARCTQADIVPTVDTLFAQPQLGMCHRMYLKTFTVKQKSTKTLMFFNGCASHLGCTIILRGGSNQVLKRVKKVLKFMIYVAYNWQLESSFLKDEKILPSAHFKKRLTMNNILEANGNDQALLDDDDDNEDLLLATPSDPGSGHESKCPSRGSAKQEDVCSLHEEHEEKKVSKLVEVIKTELVDDFSDPLHLYADSQAADSDTSVTKEEEEQIKFSPRGHLFQNILKDRVLGSSPFIKFTAPYLESNFGRKCELRKYFPGEIYYSQYLAEDLAASHHLPDDDSIHLDRSCLDIYRSENLNYNHNFLSMKIVSPAQDDKIRTALAAFRAQGGRGSAAEASDSSKNEVQKRTSKEDFEKKPGKLDDSYDDALDPFNHQRLTVLFCSFSPLSSNAPGFCVEPWVVNMDFYGHNDISLGSFLERYCFRPTYVCASDNCSVPMTDHIRRFVHESSCISITLRHLKTTLGGNTGIVMWSWCPDCKALGNPSPMSPSTWLLSFAKYLELRFQGVNYVGYSGGLAPCMHSLHHTAYQYFRLNDIVVSFRYYDIHLWEAGFPPIVVKAASDFNLDKVELVAVVKEITVIGYSVYSRILERLCKLRGELENSPYSDLIQQMMVTQKKDHATFRKKLEDFQTYLSTPSQDLNSKDVFWKLQDSIVQLKQFIAHTVHSWNTRLSDFMTQKKREEKSAKLPKRASSASFVNENVVDISELGHTPNLESQVSEPDSVLVLKEDTAEMEEGAANESCSAASTEDLTECEESISRIVGESSEECLQNLKNFENILKDPNCSSDLQRSTDSTEECHEDSLLPRSRNAVTEYSHFSPLTQAFLKYFESSASAPSEAYYESKSVKAHRREKSDGDIINEDSSASKSISEMERKTVDFIKHISGSFSTTIIHDPFDAKEHILLPPCVGPSIIINEDQPSSMIAYTLSSADYNKQLTEFVPSSGKNSNYGSPEMKRKFASSNSTELPGNVEPQKKSNTVLNFLRHSTKDLSEATKQSDLAAISPGREFLGDSDEVDGRKESSKGKGLSHFHIEVQFTDSNTKFYCKVYFVEQFRQLRKHVIPDGEDGFIRSLSHCFQWAAKGGKSGSKFCKTVDDRFILKEMSRSEIQSFLDFAPHYFNYMNKACLEQKPTVLAKILGVYRIGFDNSNTNSKLKLDLLVIENLFYGRSELKKFDLKGSVRNRLVNVSGKPEEEIVLLDENLLKMTCDEPLYIRPHTKSILSQAVNDDTSFLSSQSVMDYSLLVGMDSDNSELVVGIIDYIRTFTWDKKLEMFVKYYSALGSGKSEQAKLPTVLSPELYRTRFCEAMRRYFLPVPDRWGGLGKGMDC